MMSKPSRLEPIADYAELRENEAARRLAESARNLQAKENDLERLRGYLAEYRQRAELEEHPVGSVRWQNSRAFLAKLSDAVAAHEAEVEKALERHRLETERWRNSHLRSKTLDRVLEKARASELVALGKRDQAELDERSLRQALQSRG